MYAVRLAFHDGALLEKMRPEPRNLRDKQQKEDLILLLVSGEVISRAKA